MTPTQFVNQLFTNAGVTPSTSDRNAAIAEFGSATSISDITSRSRALRDVAENSSLHQQEFNRAFVLMQFFGNCVATQTTHRTPTIQDMSFG